LVDAVLPSAYTDDRGKTLMTLTLDVPHDLEARLTAEATRRGLSVAETLIELARSATSEAPPEPDNGTEEADEALLGTWPDDEPRPTNGAELVAYWQRHGLIGSRPEITDSLEHVRAMRRKAETRDWS
jgi:hypothetical protein